MALLADKGSGKLTAYEQARLRTKSRELRLELEPMTKGGGQERGVRPGTLQAYLCAAFREACAIAKREILEGAMLAL